MIGILDYWLVIPFLLVSFLCPTLIYTHIDIHYLSLFISPSLSCYFYSYFLICLYKKSSLKAQSYTERWIRSLYVSLSHSIQHGKATKEWIERIIIGIYSGLRQLYYCTWGIQQKSTHCRSQPLHNLGKRQRYHIVGL